MFKNLLILLCLSSVILLLSCSDDDDDNPVSGQQITGSGNPVVEQRTLPAFHTVTLTTVGTVWVSVGTSQSVQIEVDDNIMDYIVTTVVNGELFISSDPTVSLSDFDLYVTLSMTDIRSLKLTGVGSIVSEGSPLDLDSLYLALSGVGDISVTCHADYLSSSFTGVGSILLAGSVDYHRILHSAVGAISAFECSSDTTVAVLSGIGNAEVLVDDVLNVTISGRGSLYYRGTPTITSTITGLGRVIDANPSD